MTVRLYRRGAPGAMVDIVTETRNDATRPGRTGRRPKGFAMQDFIIDLQNFVTSLPEPVQFLGVFLVGLIPFVESHLGSVIGIAAGVPVPLAVLAATAGNVVSVLAFVYVGATVRGAFRRGRDGARDARRDRGRSRVRENMERFGVPGASLIGPVVLPSQFTSTALVGAGARRGTVVAWTLVAVVLWGVVSGGAAAGLFGAAGLI